MRQINIVGAGIGGITAALALRRRGFHVSIFERTPQFAAVGAGIVLAPNAVRILAHLGVDLGSGGYPLLHLRVRDRRGKPLQTLDLARLAPSIGPPLAFDRVELHETLARSLGADVVQFGCPYSLATLVEGDVLIGADGIHSAVRDQALGRMQLRYSGFTCWRGICRNPGVTEAFEDWGGAERIGVVPLTRDRIYVFLVQAAARGLPLQTRVASIRPAFASFAKPVPDVLDALAETELLHHDIEELARPVWGRGRSVLIGDAAHAMTPNQGQGASMAIEDAIVLPDIVTTEDPASAIAALRHSRVAKIQSSSRWLGEIAHWRSPVAVAARDLLVRSVPQSFGERQYAKLIEGGPALNRDG